MQAFKYCFAILLLCLPLQALAEFCTVDNFGNIGLCFPTAAQCRMAPTIGGGGCIFRQGGAGSQGGNTQSSDFDKAMEPLRELGKSRQRKAKELRASMPDFLLPLSSEPMSRETVAIITSTLNTALEMDGASTPRNWKNPTTGSQGLVVADAQKTSQYGSICREFFVIMDSRGKRTGIKGNACRVAGEWKIPGSTPLEFRDGKIVQDETAPSASRNTEVEGGSPSGRRAGYSTSPFSSANLIMVADKTWTRCLVGQSWDSTDNGKCNGRVSVEQFEERMNLLKSLPYELRGGDWRIPTRMEMLDFFNKLNVEGRLAEIGSGGKCEWSNDAIDEKSAYSRDRWPSDTYFQLYAKKKSLRCGVRLVSDSPTLSSPPTISR